MISIAFRTLPFTNTESQIIIDVPADVAAFRRREETVNLIDMAAIPLAFVFEHIDEGIPAAIADGFSKAMISNHVADGKILNVDRLVIANKLNACLMEKVLPLVRDLFMLTCKSFNCFLTVSRSLLFSGDSTLKLFKFLLGFSEKVWRFNNFSVRRCNERFDSIVKPDFATRVFGIGNVHFTENRSVISTRRCLGNGDRLRDTFNLPVKDYLDPFTLWYIEFPFIDRPMLRSGKGLLVAFLLEARKRGAFIEEVVIGNIKVSKGLLQRLRVDFFEPFKFRFQLCQCAGVIKVIKPFLRAVFIGSIEVNTLSEEVIIYKARAAKLLSQGTLVAFY